MSPASTCPAAAATYGFANFSVYSATILLRVEAGSGEELISSRNMMLAAPSGPMTAISAVGQANTKSALRWREHIAMYPPPYAFRRISVIFGTVASL